jgi:L-fucose isomerase-like protein
MEKAGSKAITINECMGTIMPLSETTACLTLSLINDAGYQAFCESDLLWFLPEYFCPTLLEPPSFINDPTIRTTD